MNTGVKWLLGIVVVVLVVLFIGRDTSQDVSNVDEIRIGSILLLTGNGAAWGESSRNGIDLAIKDINDAGGILGKKMTVVYEDDGGDPTKTVSAFRKLTDVDGVRFIIGPTFSKNGLAIMDLITDQVVISPSLGNGAFNEASEYIFNTRQHDSILSVKLAEYVFEKGYRNVALLSANDVYTKEQATAFTSRFEELGGTIGLLYEPLPDEKDVRTELLKLTADATLDAVVVTSGAYDLTSIFGKQMREVGIDKPVYSLTLGKTVIDNCLGSCDGWEYISAFTPDPEFKERYETTYSRNIEVSSDSAYDAVMLLAQAIEETESVDTNVIQKYLNRIDEYDGVSGNLVADGEGGFTKNYVVMTVQNGESVEIK